jgi:hypothetical protein
MHDGAEITTIEGLASGETLHRLQAAFIEHDAFQCGDCTLGQIVSGGRLYLGRPRELARRDQSLDERQHLPLPGLSGHRRGDRRSRKEELTAVPRDRETGAFGQDRDGPPPSTALGRTKSDADHLTPSQSNHRRRRKANETGVPMSIAVLDGSGHLTAKGQNPQAVGRNRGEL